MSLRKGNSGLPLLEISVVASVAAILISVFLHYSLYYVELSEKSAMDLLVTHMRSGLRLEKARLYSKGAESDIQKLENANPILWLKNPPSNYLGERIDISPTAIPPGQWVFIPTDHTLYYQPQRNQHLYVGAAPYLGPIQFRTRSISNTAKTSANANIQADVELATLSTYDWF